MRTPRLPPLDTTGYISCPIDTPLHDFDKSSPLPCIIVTPSSPTEYHIAFHHKSSPLKSASFAAQQLEQQQQQPRARRVLLTALNPFIDTSTPSAQSFDMPPRRLSIKPRTRTAVVLAVPIFIIVCHILASSLLRTVALGGTLFGGTLSHGGFPGAAAHMRAQRGAQLQPPPAPVMAPASAQHKPLDQPADPQPGAELNLD